MNNQNEIMNIIRDALKSNDKYDEIIKFASKFDEFTALRDQISKEDANDDNYVGFSLYSGDYSEKAIIAIIEDWVRMKHGNADTELAELQKANADLREENIKLKEILDKLGSVIIKDWVRMKH